MPEEKAWLIAFAHRFALKWNIDHHYGLIISEPEKNDTGGYYAVMESEKLPDALKIELWLDEYVTHKEDRTKMLWVGFSFAGASAKDKIRDVFPNLSEINDRDVKGAPNKIKHVEPDTINGFKVGEEAFEYYEKEQTGYLGKYLNYKDPHKQKIKDELFNECYEYISSRMPTLRECLS